MCFIYLVPYTDIIFETKGFPTLKENKNIFNSDREFSLSTDYLSIEHCNRTMNKEILKRFFEGKSNRWEKKHVQEYLEGDDMRVLDEYIQEQGASDAEQKVDPVYRSSFFNELTARIEKQENPVSIRKKLSFIPLLKIAASIVIICSVGGFLYLNRQKQSTAEAIARITRISNTGRNLKMVELADGTRIWMNPGTTIAYNKASYGDSTRQVSLTGEAYFNVAHDVKKPFLVKAGQLTTTVLGTSFNVEAYENEPEMRVMLVTGKVRINAGSSEEILYPGQMLDFSKQHETIKISSVDISDKQEQYTKGRLVFENLPLKEVLKRVERVFGLQITITDENILKNKRITGAYYRDNAESVLKRILFIHGLHHHQKGENNYVIGY